MSNPIHFRPIEALSHRGIVSERRTECHSVKSA